MAALHVFRTIHRSGRNCGGSARRKVMAGAAAAVIATTVLTTLGVPPSVAAPAGNALALNGSSQYATLGSAADLRSATFTVELWLKRTGAGVAASTGSGGFTSAIPLIAKGRAEAETAVADINYFLGIDSVTGRLVADFEEAQVAQGGTSPGLNHPVMGATAIAADSVWHHVAATYDGTTWALYLDGVSDAVDNPGSTPPMPVTVGRPANALTNTATTVGTARTTGNAALGFFAGVVDEPRVWNTARSVSQIQATKNVEITAPQAGLVGAWNLNEGTGTSLIDSANVPGMAGATVATPTWTTGFEVPGSPIAVADTYVTGPDTPLNVAAPGVLGNDTDSQPLTAVLDVNVTHGSLTLNPNGSFTYTPTPGYTGGDFFTYHANDGTLNSGIVTVSIGIGNNALALNGSSQYATLGSAADLRSATFTVELWLKRTGAGVAASTGSGGFTSAIPLIAKGRAEAETAAADINYFLGIDSVTGRLVADFEEAQVAQGGTSPGLNHPVMGATAIAADSVWHHVAATYDGTTWALYLDGVSDAVDNPGSTPPMPVTVGRPANALTNTATTVGTARTTGNAALGFFAGVVDEPRVWNTARSVSQIQATKNVEITAPQAGLVGAWNLNEGTGTSLIDSANVPGMAGATVATPTWTTGFVPPATSTAPGAPTIGAASAGDGSATVSWTAPLSDGGSPITGYTVTPFVGSIAQPSTTVGVVLSTSVTGLTNGTVYTFKIAAVNVIGTGPQSSDSNQVTPTAPATAPNAPTLNAPADGSTGVSTSPILNVGVSDPNGGNLTVTYFGRPLASGNFAQIAQNGAVASGSNDTAPWNGRGAGQTYEWYVTVNDGTLTTTGPTWRFHTIASDDPVFVGAGDIADCGRTQDEATGAVIGGIDGTIWTTGDNVYPTGTLASFNNCYDSGWGGCHQGPNPSSARKP